MPSVAPIQSALRAHGQREGALAAQTPVRGGPGAAVEALAGDVEDQLDLSGRARELLTRSTRALASLGDPADELAGGVNLLA
jgi:hypothetical protein